MNRLLIVCLVTLLSSGCGGEFSYKQGASAQDLSAAKSRCKNQGFNTETDVAMCLENNGWKVSQLDDLDLFAEASVTDNRLNKNVAEESAFVTVEKETSETTNFNKNTPKAKVDVAEEKKVEDLAEAKPEVAKSPKNPLDIYVVSSWWKMGAGRNALENDMDACVSQLGEAHKPNTKTQQVTRGLVVCLYEKGWKGLKAK
jgi:hypothetical protein